MADKDIFDLTSEISRFWLPGYLHNLAQAASAACHADGCSIYLCWPLGTASMPELRLAATTRAGLQSRLFALDSRHAYTLNADTYREAAALLRRLKRDKPDNEAAQAEIDTVIADRYPTVGLTGWVATFDIPLRLGNLHDAAERERLEGEDVPYPIWGRGNRSYYDLQEKRIPRPLLVVPMRARGGVVGAIRVSTLRQKPRGFQPKHQEALQRLADGLARLLDERHLLDDEGLAHYFRIWGADDVGDLAQRIANAVPELHDVDGCAFFLRDSQDRFVLRQASAPRFEGAERARFERFLEHNRDLLYYKAGDGSKTTTCLEHDSAVVLTKQEAGSESLWSLLEVDGTQSDASSSSEQRFRSGSSGSYIDGSRPAHELTCEFDPNDTRQIILVPVRDVINVRRIAGILRVASKKSSGDLSGTVRALEGFATSLAGEIAEAWKRQLVPELRRDLTALHEADEDLDVKLARAAGIVGKAVGAGAVTIFTRSGDTVVASHSACWLAPKYEGDKTIGDHHHSFKTQHLLPTGARGVSYNIGEGRTGWVAKTGNIVNMKDAKSSEEIGLWASQISVDARTLRAGISNCELPHPGPFIALPICMGPGQWVDGVLRLLRRQETEHGSFTEVHEEILVNCGAVLAAIIRKYRQRTVVISYSTTIPSHLNLVGEWVRHAGGQATYVPPRSVPNPATAFRDEARAADAAITIASDEGGGKVSDAVKAEYATLRGIHRDRHILLVQKGVDFEVFVEDAPHRFEFSAHSEGLDVLAFRVLAVLKEWWSPD